MPLGCRFVSTHRKIVSVENDYTLLPCREWNQKQKHKKTALEQSGMLRIWRCDCALCVIGNEFPCHQPHNPSATLLRGPSTLPQGQKPLAVSRRKTPDDKMISWKKAESNLPKQFCMVGTRHFESTEKVKPTFRLKVNNREIVVLPFFFCLS